MRYLIVIAVILTACSPAQRLSKLCTKYPYLCNSSTVDSMIIRTNHYDTIIEYKYSYDSSFYFDTVNNIQVQKFMYRDSFFTTLKSAPCTTFLKQTINRPQILQERLINSKWLLTMIIGAILLLILLRWIFK
jgi:hypothetical protein